MAHRCTALLLLVLLTLAAPSCATTVRAALSFSPDAYWGTAPGAGCIMADPLFCGGQGHPYWLQQVSPARQAGIPPWLCGKVPLLDIEGRPRPGADGFADMGAYEDNPACQ